MDYLSLQFESSNCPSGGICELSRQGERIDIFSLGYSGKYRWTEFYLPVQLSFLSSTVSGDVANSELMAPKYFAGVGAGYTVSESINLEFMFASYYIPAASAYKNGLNLETAAGSIHAIELVSKYLF